MGTPTEETSYFDEQKIKKLGISLKEKFDVGVLIQDEHYRIEI